MRKQYRRLGALLLALFLLAGCAGKAQSTLTMSVTDGGEETDAAPAATETPKPTASPSAAPEETPATGRLDETGWPSADGIHADVDFADMEWYLYDMTEFDARAEELSTTEDQERAEELYTWLVTEYKRLQTLDELAWIQFYADNSDEASQRCQQMDEMLTSAGDTLLLAVSESLNSPGGEELSAMLGEEDTELLSDYDEMTDRELELLDQETELTLAYNDLMMRDDLDELEMGREAGDIFLELIAVRNELAEIYGCDSYAEYAYENVYVRDYTPEDAAALCEAIHPYARIYYKDCCYCDAFYKKLGPGARKGPEALIAMLREYAPRISPQAAAAAEYLDEHGLYLLGPQGEISDMGFTATLEYYNAPFLYYCLGGSINDTLGIFHEFGHCYDAYTNQKGNILTDGGSFDVFEIHSTSLEALSYFWSDELYGDAAEEGRIYCLDSLMYCVVSGCMFDEFLQYAYSHPDLTVEELCDYYAELCEAYGCPVRDEEDRYYWTQISHNFESPFYYISYAASALASLQVWSLASEDFDAALALYNRLVELGAYDLSYCELLQELGLTLFTEDLAACIEEPLQSMRRSCLRYDGLVGVGSIPAFL